MKISIIKKNITFMFLGCYLLLALLLPSNFAFALEAAQIDAGISQIECNCCHPLLSEPSRNSDMMENHSSLGSLHHCKKCVKEPLPSNPMGQANIVFRQNSVDIDKLISFSGLSLNLCDFKDNNALKLISKGYLASKSNLNILKTIVLLI